MNEFAKKLIAATEDVDWGQLYLNGGGCFHVEGRRICGRGAAWAGHGLGAHAFIPLDEAIARAVEREREAKQP